MRYVYDIECLKNLFTATFVNVENESDIHVFYIGLDRPDYTDLLKFLKQEMTLVGYNNRSYDDPMLRFVMGYNGAKINTDLHNLSEKLVDDNFRDDKTIIELRYPRRVIYPWNSIDLMTILAFDKLGISLKQTAINLKWHKIQEMPINHNASVQDVQLPDVLSYNLNDVLITKKLYEEITPLRKLRESLSVIYGVNLNSASDSKMANLILEQIYASELKMDIRAVRDMRTKRYKVLLGNCIAKFVQFQSPELKEMLDRISTMYVYDYTYYKYSEKVYFANNTFSLGIGGLHSEDEAGKFETDDKHIIQDMDVSSYYPNLIINNNFYPEHLGTDFIKVLKRITEERLAAKKAKDRVKADGLKITVNSIFGKMGSEHFWLQDAKQMLSTTLSGQLGLLMLIEGLHLNGIPVISCNTDGVVCKIPRELENKYYEVAHAWERATQCELEFTQYKKYVRRDVNSYIVEKQDGTIKEKGAFLKEVDLKKSYHMPIVAKALYGYFIKGTPIRDTLKNCKDIMEFCISQKSGADFEIELHKINKIEHLQKTNRFYISNKGGSLIKRQIYSKKLTGLYVGHLAMILNDYDPATPFREYDVNLAFYEKEVMKIVDAIEPPQLSLFELGINERGIKTKMSVPAHDDINMGLFDSRISEDVITVDRLNKLGKNQLAKRLESVVGDNKKIGKISPRYIYIMEFDARTMTADIYCLAKGIQQSIGISKAAYKKNRLQKGDLVYCSRFEKMARGHIIADYRITEKIEIDKNQLM
jgi:hypothetical protein